MGALTAERWQRVEALFHEALDLTVAERPAFLARACGADTALLAEVTSLLASQDTVEPLLERRVGLAPTRAAQGLPTEFGGGTLLGAWRILRLIGRGGMGEVYAAERADGQFQQQAAIKVLRSEAAEHLDRFQAERQILARLEHPGIARLLDGGITADGRPFMVMEYVDGRPLTEHCFAGRLDLAERLELFDQVCEAVAYAHSHLVVHRDLKSGNILVTPGGRVKLLDFGVAKLLDPASWPGGETVTRTAPLTPDHAAPEQLLGQPVTTATDVYALGIVLHELLCGRSPWASLRHLPVSIALNRMLLEDPLPPSCSADESPAALPARLLRGDLDAIVGKALRKEASSRYPTVAAFSADLRAYGAGEPVSAGPDRLWYRTSKFVRRHRVGLAIATAFVLMLSGFTWRLAMERDRAVDAERRARHEADTANQVADYLVSLFKAVSPEQTAGRPVEPRRLVDMGLSRIEGRLLDQPEMRARLLATLGQAYSELGLVPDAESTLKEALFLQEAQADADPSAMSNTLLALGVAQARVRKFEEAVRTFTAALNAAKQAEPVDQGRIAEILLHLGQADLWRGYVSPAVQVLRESLSLYEELEGKKSVNSARALAAFGLAMHRSQRWSEGRSSMQLATQVLHEKLGNDHPEYIEALWAYGHLLYEQGEHDAAEDALRIALEAARKVFGAESAAVTDYEGDLANVLNARGRVREAVALERKIVDVTRRVMGPEVPAMALLLGNLAFDLEELGEYEEALSIAEEAIRIGNLHGTPADTSYVSLIRTRVLIRLGRLTEALAFLKAELPEQLSGNLLDGIRGNRLMQIGDCMRKKGDLAAAGRYYADARAVFQRSQPPNDSIFPLLKRREGLLFAASGEHELAVREFRAAHQAMLVQRGPAAPRTLEVQLDLAESLMQLGKRNEAQQIVDTVAPIVSKELAARSEPSRKLATLMKRLSR